jgi:hypothetical protein
MIMVYKWNIVPINKRASYPRTCRGGLWGSEMLRIPHRRDSRFIDGGNCQRYSTTALTPQKHFSASGTRFC